MTINEWIKYYRMKLRRYQADAPQRVEKAQRDRQIRQNMKDAGERVEWMDRLDLADQYRAKRSNEGWIQIDNGDDRTGATWKISNGSETTYVRATMDDWNGQMTEKKIAPPKGDR